MLMVTKERKEL